MPYLLGSHDASLHDRGTDVRSQRARGCVDIVQGAGGRDRPIQFCFIRSIRRVRRKKEEEEEERTSIYLYSYTARSASLSLSLPVQRDHTQFVWVFELPQKSGQNARRRAGVNVADRIWAECFFFFGGGI